MWGWFWNIVGERAAEPIKPVKSMTAELGTLVGREYKYDYQKLVNGIDVSHHNGVIDFQKVKDIGIINAAGNTPVEFCFVKVTEGAKGRDPRAGANAAGCYKIGLPWGPYHFCTLDRKDVLADAEQEAAWLMKRLGDLPPYQMPIALDVELEDKTVKLTDQEVETWIKTFFRALEAGGHGDYVLYSYSPFLREHLPPNHSLSSIRLWAARYSGKLPEPVQGWGQKFWCWQYYNAGKVAGINGPVDLNRILG